MINLLYLSCHSQLEYNELLTFKNLGFNVKSIGAYTDPHHPFNPNEQKVLLDLEPDPDFIAKAKPIQQGWPNTPLTKELVKDFDIIVITHSFEVLDKNFEVIKDKILIRRTVGQGHSGYEALFSKYNNYLKTVRVSKNERNYKPYLGEHAIILGALQPSIYDGNWVGDVQKVLTIKNRIKKNPWHTRYETWKFLVTGFEHLLIGGNNEDVPKALSGVSHATIVEALRHYRVCICMPSRPAPLTYGLQEALMMGIPIITLGPNLGDGGEHTYEHHEIIENGVSGFYSDDLYDLRDMIQILLVDDKMAKEISENEKQLANRLFHPKVIQEQWKNFFNSIGVSI